MLAEETEIEEAMTEQQRELLNKADKIKHGSHLAIRMLCEGRPEVIHGFNRIIDVVDELAAALRPFLTPPTDLAAVAELPHPLRRIINTAVSRTLMQQGAADPVLCDLITDAVFSALGIDTKE